MPGGANRPPISPELEAQIRTALTALAGQTTIVEITHRLGATANADVVAVMDQGRLVEFSGGEVDASML